jgi:ribA/ribD-fused uncharacterized protein
MESLLTPQVISQVTDFIGVAKKDPKAEVECKLLSGRIQTKNVADRVLKALQTLSVGKSTEEDRLTLSYRTDNIRVSVVGLPRVHKVCVQNSFKDVPLLVEQKKPYYEKGYGKSDTVDVQDLNTKFTLRSEKEIRRDWDGNPNDPKTTLRIMKRKSFLTQGDLFRIDFSMVKSRPENSKQSIKDVIKQQHKYELEIEFVNKKTMLDDELIVKEYMKIMTVVLQSFYESPFLLSNSDIQKYVQEFNMSSNAFYSPVTLKRNHIALDIPHNISKGYTVTVKADGERAALYVARDRRVLRIPTSIDQLVWTGITALDDSHVGDFLDGEYIPEKNLFCIFDVSRFRNRDVKSLPLMTTDEDMVKNPLKSRLGCAKMFVEDLKTQFAMNPSATPLRVETKLYLAGDGTMMEEAIKTMLETKFEYNTDGLIFTPRTTGMAPSDARRGATWVHEYKWKPPTHNSIDFLMRFTDENVLDPINGQPVKKGNLFVSKTAGGDIVYPRQTMNGEYVPPKLPEDLQKVAQMNTRIPAPFQPSAPRDPDAYIIYVPVDAKGQAIDQAGERVEDNTIIECVFDIENYRWVVMRTRYDKTYKYRVLKEPNYGNDVKVAEDNWESIHVPVTDQMLMTFVSNPPDVTAEDDSYYRDDLKRTTREFEQAYDFHNQIKATLFAETVKKGDTLLELACGRGGDMHKWKRARAGKVVAMDISLANIESPKQGAVVRYLKEKRNSPHEFLPPTLYLQGDMTEYPLFEQEDRYMPILTGAQSAPTEYLAQFEGLNKFDTISCQFAMHYACESEEVFRAFAKNIQKYGKDIFFGTCSDGQAIYSLLLGKVSHLFTNGKTIVGEYTKQYTDRETWTEEFGMPVKVYLESFEKPAIEYLVPFGKVTDIMKEHGYELVDSKNFQELYSQQTKFTLNQQQQTFSFLNRTFVFKRMKGAALAEAKAELEEEKKEEPETEKKEETETDKKEDTEKKVEVTDTEKPKRRKLKKGDPEPEPVLFFGADESKGPHRNLSNMSAHPIEIEGVKYPTVEHYFQAMKAKEFDDQEVFDKIVKSKTPKAAKALGKKVKKFVTEVWDAKRDLIMETGLRAKFVQHPELRKELMATEDKLIGEADPRNTYWGIGTSMDLEKSKTPSKWRGQNKLGKMLMTLRSDFKAEST